MMVRLLVMGLLLAAGCKKDAPPPPPPQAATPAPTAEEKPAPVPGTPEPEVTPPPTVPAPPSSQETLASVLRDVACLTKRADRDGLAKIYAGHGFRRFVLCLGYKADVIKRYFLD